MLICLYLCAVLVSFQLYSILHSVTVTDCYYFKVIDYHQAVLSVQMFVLILYHVYKQPKVAFIHC